MDTMEKVPTRAPDTGTPRRRSGTGRRRALLVGALIAVLLAALVWLRWGGPGPVSPEEVRGSAPWARANYGDADARNFEKRNIVEIQFLGRSMFVNRKAGRHFLRLARLFEARAPDYAAAVALGELDDWSYHNRDVVGGDEKSNHAFGLAVDVNALSNPLGTAGDMPEEVVRQWEVEGGDWGGDWARPDPMHFETHLTPEEIKARYRRDGSPRQWFLEQLTG